MKPWRRFIQGVVVDATQPVLPWLALRVFSPWPQVGGKRLASGQVEEQAQNVPPGTASRASPQSSNASVRPSPHHAWETSATGSKKASGLSDKKLDILRNNHPDSNRALRRGVPEDEPGTPAWLRVEPGFHGDSYGKAPKGESSPPERRGVRAERSHNRPLNKMEPSEQFDRQMPTLRTSNTHRKKNVTITDQGLLLRRALSRLKMLESRGSTQYAAERQSSRVYARLAKPILDRYEAYIKKLEHYRALTARRAESKRQRLRNGPSGQDTLANRTISVMDSSPGHDHAGEKAAINISSVWNESVAKLRVGLLEVPNVDEAAKVSLNLPSDAKVWFDILMDQDNSSFSSKALAQAIRQSVMDRRRKTMRKTAGLQPDKLGKSGLTLNDVGFVQALEATLWHDACFRLWPDFKSDRDDDIFIRHVWQASLLYGLAHRTLHVPDFLMRTDTKPSPPRYMCADALELSIVRAQKDSPDASWWQQVAKVISTMALASDSQLRVPGYCLTIVLQHLSLEDTSQCIKDWQSANVRVPANTLLHVVDRLTKHSMHWPAIEVLQENMGDIIRSVKSRTVHSVLTAALSGIAALEDNLHVCQQIVTEAMRHGYTPDQQDFNAIMNNAVKANDIRLVFDLYDTMRSNGLSPNHYTFAILARACKSSDVHEERLTRIIREALQSGVLLESEVVAAEILCALYEHHIAKRPNEAYGLIVEAYEQLFDSALLEKVGLLQSKKAPTITAPLLQPDVRVLAVMLQVFLAAGNPTSSQALALYQRTVQLAKDGTRPMQLLLESEQFWHAFIKFFGANTGTMHIAVGMLKARQSLSLANGQSQWAAAHLTAGHLDQADYSTWFAVDVDFAGLDRTTILLAFNMFARQSSPTNSLLPIAERMLDYVQTKIGVDERSIMVMLRTYLRLGDGQKAQECISKLEELPGWDEVRAGFLRREAATAVENQESV